MLGQTSSAENFVSNGMNLVKMLFCSILTKQSHIFLEICALGRGRHRVAYLRYYNLRLTNLLSFFQKGTTEVLYLFQDRLANHNTIHTYKWRLLKSGTFIDD